MTITTLKFLKDPEYFFNIEENILTEIYSFNSSQNKDLFKLGNSYLTVDSFKFEVHRRNVTNILHNIFFSFNNLNYDKVNAIAYYFNLNKKPIKTNKKTKDITFSINPEIVEKIKFEYPNNHSSSLLFFNLLDEEEHSILFNFKFYEFEN